MQNIPFHHFETTLSFDVFAEGELTSTSATDTADFVDASQHQEETLERAYAELRGVTDDSPVAKVIMAGVEVVLADDISSRNEIAENVVAVAVAEGVPEEFAFELVFRW